MAVTSQALAKAGMKEETAAAFVDAVQAALSIGHDWRVGGLLFIARKMPE
jgi:hypothetical protein